MFMITGYRSKKALFRAAVCLLIALIIIIQGGVPGSGNAYASSGSEKESADGTAAAGNAANITEAVNTSSGLITINMVDADIRDILSTIALSMDASVIYLETPAKVSFSAKDVTPEKALELLVQSISTDSGQLGYIRDGKVIIIGAQDKLQKDFFNQMALTRFRVTYISPKVLSDQLDKLSIPAVKITLDESSNFIWVQGTPKSLTKVASVISALDKRENFDSVDGELTSSINLIPITLDYITSEQLNALIKQLNIAALTIRLDTNPMVLWVSGTKQEMLDINQLVALVDIPQSKGESSDMTYIKLKNITYDKLITIVSQMDLSVQIIRVGSGQKSLWLKGTLSDINELKALVTKLDISDNGEEVQFFIYRLSNISPTDAQTRLEFLGISSVEVLPLNYPQMAHEILIKCPYDMIGTVSRVLTNIDVQGQTITAPVDSAVSAYQLTKRKILLSKLMNLPEENFTISDNVAKDASSSYYIMWVVDTPENIMRIKEMVKLIDAP
jgi:type II secretory pathway component GspD/PulD (secretin)